MLLHNNGWEIERSPGHRDAATLDPAPATTGTGTGSGTGTGDYWLVPPPGVDPQRVPRLMPSRSAALRDLLTAAPA